ncbi:hypothetical protein SAMN05660860_00805 [Geoalkalibacter ferrihydriticus]|uniref:Uncharacterized protein n=1 Tax=Geoalkalibacter ferrihydriticus TaxID=392333 RepID=A0A1G9KLL5_9BACT|nr:DUF493 domain-containing protein [Geoalkalibacter ferrihydriticus]SDL50690.1 hypothetical protein SAMN05660860_00805 [Geoalkalibacter ferrihydriticus]
MPEQPRAEDLLNFPCDHLFKAMGPNSVIFIEKVRRAVAETVPIAEDAVKTRASTKGNYLSVTVRVHLENFDQLTRIYASLRKIDELKFLL